MTGSEGLAQLIQNGLFPEDMIGDLLRLVEDVDARVARGELTEEQAAELLDAHAECMVAKTQRQRGPFSKADNELATAISTALNADPVPS